MNRRYPRQQATMYDPYDKLVAPYVDNFPDVYLSKQDIETVMEFSKRVAGTKRQEGLYQRDGDAIEGRFFNGFCGEMANQRFIGRTVIDLSIGNSRGYTVSDLRGVGLRCGVKTGKVGSFPKVLINSEEPEIIVLKMSEIHYKICGVAMPDILRDYSGDEDIDEVYMNPNLLRRNVKTCFFGHGQLVQFYNFKQLKELLYEEGFSDTL